MQITVRITTPTMLRTATLEMLPTTMPTTPAMTTLITAQTTSTAVQITTMLQITTTLRTTTTMLPITTMLPTATTQQITTRTIPLTTQTQTPKSTPRKPHWRKNPTTTPLLRTPASEAVSSTLSDKTGAGLGNFLMVSLSQTMKTRRKSL
ncbi:hypothetical protein M011DRAFT_337922 [Sporormia fimetaria CBS 119925]|uniref:Uncharacterized protein n=1 Tax=Sporormia fimetaria CBS 119925 TaxID=1340428 RepID=A0A6A6VE01_9PLEO|nr:hypothetical protein M011DRAFT_337922 [Sporormia fimetaria CBS 119925]